MPTTVTSSIGTAARTYSTLQAWEDACPVDLVAVDQIWKGECYNDSEFTSTASLLSMAGVTTDATRYLWLTTAAGQSFKNHANKLTNALTYNQALGVGITSSSDYGGATIYANNYAKFTGLQVRHSRNTGGGNAAITGGAAVGIENCYVENRSTNATATLCGQGGAGNGGYKVVNSVIVSWGRHVSNTDDPGLTNTFFNCSLIHYNGGGGYAGIRSAYTAPKCYNTAVYGFSSVLAAGSLSADSNYNSTDNTAPTNWGANSQVSQVFASQFESITLDFRTKTTSNLKTAAARDAANTADLDIVGQSRSITTPTIGAWEVASGGVAAALAGNAAAVAAAAGAPTTAIPFNGATVSIATTNGMVTTAIDVVGVATGSANLVGDLFTQIKIDAAALARALVQAGLNTGISFLGHAPAQAGGGGDVTIQIALLAAAISNALTQGTLSAGTSGLAGDVAARAQVTADMTTATPLIGAPKAYAGAAGNITNIIQVVAASGAISNVTGDLTASITFTAQALAQALSQAFLTIQIRFAGTALVEAQANGTLAGTAPQPAINPRYIVEIEPRLYEAEIAPRLYEVAA